MSLQQRVLISNVNSIGSNKCDGADQYQAISASIEHGEGNGWQHYQTWR